MSSIVRTISPVTVLGLIPDFQGMQWAWNVVDTILELNYLKYDSLQVHFRLTLIVKALPPRENR